MALSVRPLPSGFPQIAQAVAAHGRGTAEPRPADLRSLAKRLRDAYSQGRSSDYRNLSAGQWRQLPYAYWAGGPQPLPEVEPRLVRWYWGKVLREALISRPTMASRWLAPLLHSYVESFNPSSRHFMQFAQQIAGHLPHAVGPFAENLRQTQRRIDFFRPEDLGKRLASDLLAHSGTIAGWLDQPGLDENFPKSPLGESLLAGLLQASPATLRQESMIDKVLTWAEMMGITPHQSLLRVPFAESLLLPWNNHRHYAAPPVRDKLLRTFASPNTYGDPRWTGRAGYQWRGVTDPAVSVVRRWLAGRSLEAFVDALKLTADETWQYREKFWMAYHRRGLIKDVWLVLGSKAHNKIGQRLRTNDMQHGQLMNDSPGQRSVLILEIGHLTFVEWSHSGALRAYQTSDPKAPKLYSNQYDRGELSDDRSLWMHDATADKQNSHLIHHGSENGTWQRKARDFIRRQTGEHLTDSEIL